MYSPKIREDLIPRLYTLAKQRQTTVKGLEDESLQKALDACEAQVGTEDSKRMKLWASKRGGRRG